MAIKLYYELTQLQQLWVTHLTSTFHCFPSGERKWVGWGGWHHYSLGENEMLPQNFPRHWPVDLDWVDARVIHPVAAGAGPMNWTQSWEKSTVPLCLLAQSWSSLLWLLVHSEISIAKSHQPLGRNPETAIPTRTVSSTNCYAEIAVL